MQISTRGRYAVRAMLDLALHSGAGPVLRHDIALRQEVSAQYAAHLLRRLRGAGLVTAVKGPGGGYTLARDAASIRLGDIVRAMEGPIAVVYCVEPRARQMCHRVDGCAAHLLWKELSGVIEQFLDAVTLQDLCRQAQHLGQEDHTEANGGDV